MFKKISKVRVVISTVLILFILGIMKVNIAFNSLSNNSSNSIYKLLTEGEVTEREKNAKVIDFSKSNEYNIVILNNPLEIKIRLGKYKIVLDTSIFNVDTDR